jgi:O-antigen ligase
MGIGNFAIILANRDQGAYMIEPVHSLPLLDVAELGIPGLILLGAAAVTLFAGIRRASNPAAVITSAILAGLTVTAVFRHYLWTLSPGRALLWYAQGFWASWSSRCASPYDSPREWLPNPAKP